MWTFVWWNDEPGLYKWLIPNTPGTFCSSLHLILIKQWVNNVMVDVVVEKTLVLEMSTSHCIYIISSVIIRTNQLLQTCNFQNIIKKNVRKNRIFPINYKQTAIVIYITKQISHTRRRTWCKVIIKSFIS